jgi:hypothetical protein
MNEQDTEKRTVKGITQRAGKNVRVMRTGVKPESLSTAGC